MARRAPRTRSPLAAAGPRGARVREDEARLGLDPLQDDDRDLPLGQLLLAREVGNQLPELFALVLARGPDAHVEHLRAQLHGGGRRCSTCASGPRTSNISEPSSTGAGG